FMYGSARVEAGDTTLPSFYQMVPNGIYQYRGILHLLLHFSWRWIGFLVANGMDLDWFIQILVPEYSKKGICFAFIELFSSSCYDANTGFFFNCVVAFYEKIMGNETLPVSLCNAHCQPGSRKKRKEGKPFCCYDCITCPKGSISHHK
ncbi:hypothetical protein E2320_002946, partial [Naja naja]